VAWSARQFVDKLGLSPGTLIYTGNRGGGVRATLVEYSDSRFEVKSFESLDQLKGKIPSQGLRWVHVEGLSDVALVEYLGHQFSIHQMSLEDILNAHHAPKISDFESYIHFVVKIVSVDSKTQTLLYDHASVILGSDFVLSFSERKSEFLRPILERFENPEGRLRKFGPAYLAFALMDLTLDHYNLAMGLLEDAVDQMETKILRRPSDLLLGKLYEVKREVALVRKMTAPMRDSIRQLNKGENALIGESYEVYYRDLEDHAVQIVDTTDSLKETLRNLLDVSDSYSAHNMNVMFKFFTAVSAIFLPLNFLASLYGMNFHLMPGVEEPLGFFLMVSVMCLIALSVAVFFRLKRWW